VSRGSALLTRLPVPSVVFRIFCLLSWIPVAGGAGCRSLVVPPPVDRTDGGGVGVLPPIASGEILAALAAGECPRRECPLPEGVVDELVARLGERLADERRCAGDARATLERQRQAIIDALRRVVRDRELRAAGIGSGPEDGLSAAAGEWLAWLRSLPSTRIAAGDSAAPRADSRAPGAGPAGPVREGRWILPLVAGWARLREAFDAAVVERRQVEALWKTIGAVEARFGVWRGLLASTAGVAEAPESPDSLRSDWEDLDRLHDALERSRSPGCGRAAGSAVCIPPPIPVWPDGEFLAAEGSDEEMLRALDELLGHGDSGTPPNR
jgi:hypothetical protein